MGIKEGNRLIVLDDKNQKVGPGPLYGLVDYSITKKTNTLDTMSFTLPIQNPFTQLIDDQYVVKGPYGVFVIDSIEPDSTKSIYTGKQDVTELINKVFDNGFKAETVGAYEMVQLAVAGTGWRVEGTNLPTFKRSAKFDVLNAYEIVMKIVEKFSIEVVFDSVNKIIKLNKQFGSNKGVYFSDQLNAISLWRKTDTKNFATRIKARGKDGLTFASINEGKDYVEDFTYSSKLVTKVWTDNRYTDPQSLLEDAKQRLSVMCKSQLIIEVNVKDLASLSPEYDFLTYDLGDDVTVISAQQGFRDTQRITELTMYPEEPDRNTATLAYNALTLEDINKQTQETVETVDNVLNEDGTIDGSKVDEIKSEQISDLEHAITGIVNLDVLRAKVDDLEANKASIKDLQAVNIDVANLKANKASIEELKAVIADVETLFTDNANINKALIGKADIGQLTAVSGRIDALEATTADIENLVNGNLTSDNIHSLHLTANKVTVDNAFIKSAMIDSVDVSKLNAGIISTDKFQVRSNDGGVQIVGSTQQFSDKNGKVRVQIGKDAKGDFNFIVRGDDGTSVLIDHTGLKKAAIADDLIVGDMIAEGAVGKKQISYSSFSEGFNEATNTSTINSSKVLLDGTGQTLNVVFNQLSTTVNKTVKSVDVLYYLSTSKTQLAGGSWVSQAPEWTANKYMWTKSVTKYVDGTSQESQPTCIAGATGAPGTPGSAGRGVTSIQEQYYLSTSATELAGGTWQNNPPTWQSGKYIWTRSLITYTDNQTSTTDPICTTGAPGKDGTSVNAIDVLYYLSTSNTTQTGGSWVTTAPAWADGKYMWTKTRTTLSSGEVKETTPVCITGGKGQTGSAGKGVTSIIEQFAISSSKVTPPAESLWKPTPPAWVKGQYIWTRSKITYTDGTSATTTPLCDSSWEAVNEVEEIVSSHSTQLTTQQGEIKALISNTTVTKSDGKVVQLKDAYNDTVATVDSMKSTIGQHTTEINKVTGQVSTVTSKVNEVERDLSGTKSTVGSHTTQITGLTKTTESMSSSISQLNNQIKLKVEKSEVTTIAKDQAKSAVDNLQVGGRNLVKDSDVYLEALTDGSKVDCGGIVGFENLYNCTITISLDFDIAGLTIANGRQRVGYEFGLGYPDGSWMYLGCWHYLDSGGSDYKGRKSTTYNLPGDKIPDKISYSAIYLQATAEKCKVGRPKVEMGSKATDWTPAPEDIDKKITDTESSIIDKYTAAITASEEGIKQSVSEIYTTKGELNDFIEGSFTNVETTVNGVKTTVGKVQTKVEEVDGELKSYQELVASYMTFTEEGLEIGKTNSTFRTLIDNEKMAFMQDKKEVAFISKSKLYITQAEIIERWTIGKPELGFFDWAQRSNGNLGLQWRRG